MPSKNPIPNLKLPRRLWKLARQLLDQPEKLTSILDQAGQRAAQTKSKIQSIWKDLQSLLRLIKAWKNHEYREVPKATIVKALFAILYFLLIVDAVPDFLPLIGFADDATVILWILSSIKTDLQRFLQWEERGTSKSDEIR